MRNLRTPSIAISPEAVRRTIGQTSLKGQRRLSEEMQFIAGTPRGAAILIERFRK